MFLYPKVATKQIPIAISTQPESLQCVFIVFEKITLRKISDSLRLGCVKTRTSVFVNQTKPPWFIVKQGVRHGRVLLAFLHADDFSCI